MKGSEIKKFFHSFPLSLEDIPGKLDKLSFCFFFVLLHQKLGYQFKWLLAKRKRRANLAQYVRKYSWQEINWSD